MSSTVANFANDTNALTQGHHGKLQKYHPKLDEWATKRQMMLNIKKSKTVTQWHKVPNYISGMGFENIHSIACVCDKGNSMLRTVR